MKKSIFHYQDYREYLKDIITNNDSKKAFGSIRALSVCAGINPAAFSRIISGKRNISLKSAQKVALALDLQKKEQTYFIQIIKFVQAKSEIEKKKIFESLLKHKKSDTAIVDTDKYAFFEQWYNIAIREFLNSHPDLNNVDEIIKEFRYPISRPQAKNALKRLVKLGMITIDTDGTYRLTDQFISTGEKWHSVAIHNLQHSLIDLTHQALETLPKEERDFSSVTLGMSKNGFDKAKEKIKECRAALMEIARNDQETKGVYQINFQAFPLTR